MAQSEIFNAAVKLPPEQRAVYLDQACGENRQLRNEIESLLQAHESPDSFLREPTDRTATYEPTAERAGSLIGPYKLIEPIGEGGMGSVWMAQQTEPVKRLVALKLIKAGMDSKQVLARFEAERQALALMDHPNIAKVFDGGTTGAEPEASARAKAGALANASGSVGRPYFVMELVKGVPITKYCDEHHLTPRQRLELFIPVCQAVQHAHQKGIIHRDLKPSNVLVAQYDGRPVPKVIDFGVAKAAGQSLTDKTLVTGFGAIVGTLEYMSPEQAEVNQLDIDTRSDIYSLGVLLYELLTGSTPFSKKDLEKAGMLEMLRVIREDEPSKPSTKLSSSVALPSLSASRGTEPTKLTKIVRGELDWIVMKALEKDRSRRYETANGFAMDVQRYLADEQVQACPPSAGYRLRKFSSRHRVALSTAGLIAVALVLGTVVSIWQAVRATQARHDAEVAQTEEAVQRTAADKRRVEADEQRTNAEAARKQAIANLQKARAAVDQMLTRVAEEKLVNVPQMEPVRKALLEDALKFYQEFLTQQNTDPTLRLETGHAWRRVGWIQNDLGHYDEAEHALRESIAILLKLVGEFPNEPSYKAALGESYSALGKLVVHVRWQAQEAEKILRTSLAFTEKIAADNPNNPKAQIALLDVYDDLGHSMYYLNRVVEAEQVFRQALTLAERLANTYPAVSDYRSKLGRVHEAIGFTIRAKQPQEAEQAFRRALDIETQLIKEQPNSARYAFQLALARQHFAALLVETQSHNEAIDNLRACITQFDELRAKFPTVSDYRTRKVQAGVQLGGCFEAIGKQREAEQAYRDGLKSFDGFRLTEYDQHFTQAHIRLAVLSRNAGRLDDADQLLSKTQLFLEKWKSSTVLFPRKDGLGISGISVGWGGSSLLSSGYSQLASTVADFGRPKEADQYYKLALEMKQTMADKYEKLPAEFPNLPDNPDNRWELAILQLQIGKLLCILGRKEDAIVAIQKSIANNERLPVELRSEFCDQLCNTCRDISSLLRTTGRIDVADLFLVQLFGHCEKAVAKVPTHPDNQWPLANAHFQLGECLRETGRQDDAASAYRKALVIFEKLTRDNSKNPLFWFRLSYAQNGLLLHDQALESLNRTIELKPMWDAYHRRGDVHSHFKQPEKAILDYTKAIELNGNQGWTWRHRAWNYTVLGQWENAIADYRQAIKLMPKEPSFHTELGDALLKVGKTDDAEQLFVQLIHQIEESVAKFPTNTNNRWELANACFGLGEFLRTSNRREDAATAYRKSIAILEGLPADIRNELPKRERLATCYSHTAWVLADIPKYAQQVEDHNRKALAIYEKLETEFPTKTAYREQLGHRYWALASVLETKGQIDESLQARRQSIQMFERIVGQPVNNPNHLSQRQHLGSALSGLAGILDSQKRPQEAILARQQARDVYEKLVAEFPNNSDHLFGRGNLHVDLGLWKEAAADFEKAIELEAKKTTIRRNMEVILTSDKSKSALYWFRLSFAQYGLHLYDQELESLNRSIELKPMWDAYHRRGYAYERLKQPTKAIQDFTKAIELHGDYGWTWRHRAWNYTVLGQWESAIADYRQAIKLMPKEPSFHTELGDVLLKAGKTGEAIQSYRMTIELDPKNSAIQSKLDETVAAQKLEFEIANLRRDVASDPKNAAAHRELGIALLNLKQNDEALIIFHKLIELEPKNANNHNYLGVAFSNLKKPTEAIAAFRKAIELDQKNIRAHKNLASSLMNSGDHAGTMNSSRRVLDLDPNDSWAMNNLAWFLLTSKDTKLRNHQEAMTWARKATELTPANWVNLDTYSLAAYRNGLWQESLDSRKKMIKLRPARTEDKFFLAMCLWQLGKKDEARKPYDEAIAEFRKLTKPNRWLTEIKTEAEGLLVTNEQSPRERLAVPPRIVK